jgi:thymidylate synthase (FAD)
MTVKFIHCTPDAEALIVRMARVSTPENADNLETAPRLLRYLLKHEHFSPFEMASLCVCINTERDIAAQILRHRSFSFQEFSTRYSKTTPAEIPAMRKQAETNRQSSTEELDPDVYSHFERLSASLIRNVYLTYEEMLTAGVARECARRILPLCTPTTLFMHGTLRSWLHFIQLRTKSDTQLEHRLIAEDCQAIFSSQFPIIAAAVWPGP